MNFSKLFKTLGITITIASASIFGNLKMVRSEAPTQIITYPGQPVVVIFSERGESYAIGCQEFVNVFQTSVVSVRNAQQWNSLLSKFPVVGDIHCNGRTRLYAPSGEPGAIVFRHRDGKYYRHYVDNIKFFSAIGGNPIPISADEFRQEFPNRGVDFHSK